ncbi:MAG: hypothetical protein A2Y24_01485 [Clostridiales bacterium GWE2_32_10]|nr:MAG: hypothetical protein A2Y24_01485 [Clostridiales bacterium GWE2_32_10]HBY19789.1 hypothetical protein [Clostridiales bacterium]
MLYYNDKMCNELEKRVNKNVNEIIEFYIDYLEISEDIDVIFPSHLVRKEKDKCINIIYDLRDFSLDNSKHKLKPIYEYALYHIINYFQEVMKDCDENFRLDTIEDTNIIKTEYDVEMAEYVGTYDFYFEELFYDYDFLYAEKYFKYWTENPKFIEEYVRIEIDDYIELLPQDIREEYETIKKQMGKESNRQEKFIDRIENIEEYVIREINNSILRVTDNISLLEKLSEDDISDYIHNILKVQFEARGISIDRENRAGFAKKRVGEVDFYISTIYNGQYIKVAVGENKEWGKFEKQYGQLLGYMNEDTVFGFTIVINRATNICEVIENRNKIILNYKHDNKNNFKVLELKEVDNLNNVYMSVNMIPENLEVECKIYHFVINAYRPERKQMASVVRS